MKMYVYIYTYIQALVLVTASFLDYESCASVRLF